MLTTEKSKPANQSTVPSYHPELLPFTGIYIIYILLLYDTQSITNIVWHCVMQPYPYTTPHHANEPAAQQLKQHIILIRLHIVQYKIFQLHPN